MAIEVFNRYEKKYMLNAIQYEKLTQAISEYMVVDAYNRDKPFYEICNIYYDTPDNALTGHRLKDRCIKKSSA